MKEKLNNYLIDLGFENVTDDIYIQKYIREHNSDRTKEYYRISPDKLRPYVGPFRPSGESHLNIVCKYDTVTTVDPELRPNIKEVIYLDYIFTNKTYDSFQNITSIVKTKCVYEDTDLSNIYRNLSRWIDTDKIIQNKLNKILEIKA